MITIPGENMNASLIELMEQCLARLEAEVEIRLRAERRLRAEASSGKTSGVITAAHGLDRRSQSKKRALARWRLRSRKRVKANGSTRNSEVSEPCK